MDDTAQSNSERIETQPNMEPEDILRAEISHVGQKFEEEIGALNDKVVAAEAVVAARDARIAELETALEQIANEGTRFETTRIGDMWDLDHGYEDAEIVSREAEIARLVLEKKEAPDGKSS